MTIKELYKWAITNNCENYDVEIQYRDNSKFYLGTDNLNEDDIEIVENTKTVIL